MLFNLIFQKKESKKASNLILCLSVQFNYSTEMPGGLNLLSNRLNKYVHEWIKNMFPFLDCINISVIGFNRYLGYWIEQIFQRLDSINISETGLNKYFGDCFE